MVVTSYKSPISCDVLVIGGGVIGLAMGIAILEAKPNLKVAIAEKERQLGMHASGRNSGVLHAGFYYSPDTFKARFCRDGNLALRQLAKKYEILIRNVGKVVVARNPDENYRLDSLFERGIQNGVELELLDASMLHTFEPLAVTNERFIWSPNTAISDNKAILDAMRKEFESMGGKIYCNMKVLLEVKNSEIIDKSNQVKTNYFVNAAGAQSDRLARHLGLANEYAMVPFMGVYRATYNTNLPLQRLVYPVPHPVNPFLGVHFTLTTDNKVKIGPTAIPISGREQYSLTQGWSASDLFQTVKGVYSLIRGSSHNFGSILRSEMPKFLESKLIQEASNLVPSALNVDTWTKRPPGIRSQLVHLPSGRLEQDFVISHHLNSTHLLNVVSPGWTSCFSFSRYVTSELLKSIR